MTVASLPTDTQADIIIQNRYQIVRRIGQGGMGAVFEAIDTRLGNVVAIKQTLPVPLEDVTGVDDPLKRAFEREARILASLRHSALPVVSDFFTEGTAQYLVMQYIPGDDLWTLLQRHHQNFSIEQVIEWTDALLDVLDYLHTHQPPILHRDIKPQNLKLTPRGEIVLLDFGLARGGTTLTSRLSTGGSLVAYTPQYAPMEQIRGLPIGARSDLYALAATVYHLLTGRLPASAMDRAAAAMEGRSDPLTPVSTLNPHVSATISDLLMRAMSPRVEERPANAAAMRAVLRRVHRPTRQMATQSHITPRAVLPLTPLDTVMSQRQPPQTQTPSQQTSTERVKHTLMLVAAAVLPRIKATWHQAPDWMKQRKVIGATLGLTILVTGLAVAVPRTTSTPRPQGNATIATVTTRVLEAPTATQVDAAARSGYNRAIETLSAAIAVQPKDARNYVSRAEAYIRLGEFDSALIDYNMVVQLLPADASGYLGRATAFAAQNNYTSAIDEFSRALAIDPGSTAALIGRAQSYFAQGDYPRAIDDYDRVIELNPDNANGYLGRGEAYMHARAYRQALNDFNQAIVIKSDDSDAYVQRGLAYVSLGEYDRATTDYDMAIRINPEDAEAYLNRGRAAFYERAYERAIDDYDRFLQLAPDSPVGLYNRGLAYSARGDQELAITDFNAYIQLRSEDPDIYLYRAMAYTRTGQRANAIADLQKCLALTTDPDLRAQAEQQLKIVANG